MTNREWLMNNISKLTNEELANVLKKPCVDICCGECDVDWEELLSNWLGKEKENPMPHITNGMFVKVRYDFDYDLENTRCHLGVRVDNRLVYADGGWDTFDTGDDDIDVRLNEIIAIYNAKSFDDCLDSSNCIWKREER